MADYFEAMVTQVGNAKLCANWVTGDLAAQLNKNGLDIQQSPVSASQLALLVQRIADNTLSGKMAKQVFEHLWANEGSVDDIIAQQGLIQVTDNRAIGALIADVMANNPEAVAQYRSGKDKLFGFFVGQIMKLSKGKANPNQVNELLKNKLTLKENQ
jgi:aspartyl-tRNA(Asn)/glutamyl-tRNA(Gln) amidotransferase subunit B